MNALTTALGSLSPQKILEYLMRKSPDLAPKIKSALASGLSAEKVVKFFSKDKNFDKLKDKMENSYSMDRNANPLVQAENTRSQNLGTDMASSLQRHAPKALGAVAGLGVNMALNHALPNLLKGSTQEISGKIPETSSQPPINPVSPAPSPNTPSSQPSIPQNPQPVQPQGILNTPSQPGKPNINEILTSIVSNNPNISSEDAAGIIKKLYPDIAKKIEQGNKKPLKDVMDNIIPVLKGKIPNQKSPTNLQSKPTNSVEEIIQPTPQNGQNPPNQPQEPQKLEQPSQELDAQPEIERPKIEKASIVAAPQGIGEVKEIRNGQAIVEVDGKKHKVSVDDLEPPAFSEDEIADAYDDLMAKIPEEHKSGFISWAGYDEDRNVLGFIPRGGKYEELHNITPEEAQRVKEGKGIARTSGEEREGLWVMGEDTRGGIISQIIHDRRKKNKTEEEKQLKFAFELPKPEKQDRGMKPVFDEMKHARDLEKETRKKLSKNDNAKRKKKMKPKKEKNKLKEFLLMLSAHHKKTSKKK